MSGPERIELELVVSRAPGYLRVLERLAISNVHARRILVEDRDADTCAMRLEIASAPAALDRLRDRLRELKSADLPPRPPLILRTSSP